MTANLSAVVVDYVDAGTDPDIQKITATVDFIPRIPNGSLVWASGLTPPQGVALPRIRGRFDTDGTLKTIVGGVGVKLTANTDVIDLDELYYDIVFSNVVYNKADQVIAAFAITAPYIGGITVDLANCEHFLPKPGL